MKSKPEMGRAMLTCESRDQPALVAGTDYLGGGDFGVRWLGVPVPAVGQVLCLFSVSISSSGRMG